MGPIPGPMGPPFGKKKKRPNLKEITNHVIQASVVVAKVVVEAAVVVVVDSSEELAKEIVVIQMIT